MVVMVVVIVGSAGMVLVVVVVVPVVMQTVWRRRNATSCQFSWRTFKLISTTSTRVSRKRRRTPTVCARSCRRSPPSTRPSRADSTRNSLPGPKSSRKSGKIHRLVVFFWPCCFVYCFLLFPPLIVSSLWLDDWVRWVLYIFPMSSFFQIMTKTKFIKIGWFITELFQK